MAVSLDADVAAESAPSVSAPTVTCTLTPEGACHFSWVGIDDYTNTVTKHLTSLEKILKEHEARTEMYRSEILRSGEQAGKLKLWG